MGKRILSSVIMLVSIVLVFFGIFEGYSAAQKSRSAIYLTLVNKSHPLPENWEGEVRLIPILNSLNEEVEIEYSTYQDYRLLREDLLKEGIQIELDSVYRSVADQQETWDWFLENYGEEYTKSHISPPGYSEHHTGFAIDIFIIKDGKEIRETEDMIADVKDFKRIHEFLPRHGFILRYPTGKEDITGYDYEPWHFRYVGSKDIAEEITEKGLTLEEYLGEK